MRINKLFFLSKEIVVYKRVWVVSIIYLIQDMLVRRISRLSKTMFLRKQLHQFAQSDDSAYFNDKTNPTLPSENERWMSCLDPSQSVSMLSIPGTHDTGTYSCYLAQVCRSSQTQSMDIATQLKAGIRFFDLRVHLLFGQLIIAHGVPFPQTKIKDIFDVVVEFLSKNPTEFVILAFQGDGNKKQKETRLQKLISLINQPKYSKYWVTDKQIPKLSGVKGKAWLYSGYGVDELNFFELLGDNTKFSQTKKYCIQNAYVIGDKHLQEPELVVTLEQKCEAVLDMVKWNKNPQLMKFNYLNGSPYDKLQILEKTPKYFAKHTEGPNAKLYNMISNANIKNPIGVTIMDYPGIPFINSIINLNEKVK